MGVVRIITQWFGLIVSHAYLKVFFTKQIYSGPLKATCIPFISCHACPAGVFSCPVGTIQHYMIIRQVPFVLLGHLGLVLIAAGRMACGWLCPFGLLQDLLYRVKSRKIKIPKIFNYFKYVTLIIVTLFLPFASGELWFCKFCPSGTLEAALPWVIWNPVNPVFKLPTVDMSALGFFFFIKVIVLIAFIGLMIISKRPFCRIFCPLGLIFGIFNKFSLLKIYVSDHSSCGKCRKCLKLCPVDIKIADNPDSVECIRCLDCMKCKKVKIGIGNLKGDVGKAVLPAPISLRMGNE